jgi:hypothetical protein
MMAIVGVAAINEAMSTCLAGALLVYALCFVPWPLLLLCGSGRPSQPLAHIGGNRDAIPAAVPEEEDLWVAINVSDVMRCGVVGGWVWEGAAHWLLVACAASVM